MQSRRIMRLGFAVTCALWAVAATNAEETQAIIRLRSEGIVTGNLVRLGEIAEIVSNDREREEALAAVELGPSPDVGKSRWIEIHALRDDLYRKGVNLTTVEFAGSRRVEVKRPSETPEPTAVAAPKEPQDYHAIVQRLIEENVVKAGLYPQGGGYVRLLGDRALNALREAAPEHWELVVSAPWKMGRQTVYVEIPSGMGKSSFPFEVVIEVDTPVVVAARPIAIGQKIEADDVRVEARRQRQDSGLKEYVSSPREMVGKVATHAIGEGQPIERRDFRAEPIVFRGSTLTVWIRQGTAEIQLAALAQEDGGMGEWITAVNPETRQTLTHKVRVLGAQMAELPPNAPLVESSGNFSRKTTRSLSRRGN